MNVEGLLSLHIDSIKALTASELTSVSGGHFVYDMNDRASCTETMTGTRKECASSCASCSNGPINGGPC